MNEDEINKIEDKIKIKSSNELTWIEKKYTTHTGLKIGYQGRFRAADDIVLVLHVSSSYCIIK